MRTLRRPSVKLPTLTSEAGFTTAQGHCAAKEADADAKLTFPEHWNKPDVRGALYAMHGRTCAYCGCNLPRNDRGDVEHFRPKSKVDEAPEHGGYWWLAYSFENYVLGCGPCNSSRKGSKFPMRPGGKHRTYAERKQLAKEPRLLLDPCVDPIEELVEVKWDDDLCPLVPRGGLAATQRLQVEGTVGFFGLNTDPGLVRERLRLVGEVAQAIADGKASDAKRAAIRYRCHSLVAICMIRATQPGEEPTGEEELDWLVDDLIEELFLKLKLLDRADSLEKKRLERALDELLYSLAVIWKDPPARTPAEVEARFQTEGVLDYVKPRYDKLA